MEITPPFLRSVRDEGKYRLDMLKNKVGTSDTATYGLEIDPYAPVVIEVAEIREWSRRPLPNHHGVTSLCGSVCGGDWDVRPSIESREGWIGSTTSTRSTTTLSSRTQPGTSPS